MSPGPLSSVSGRGQGFSQAWVLGTVLVCLCPVCSGPDMGPQNGRYSKGCLGPSLVAEQDTERPFLPSSRRVLPHLLCRSQCFCTRPRSCVWWVPPPSGPTPWSCLRAKQVAFLGWLFAHRAHSWPTAVCRRLLSAGPSPQPFPWMRPQVRCGEEASGQTCLSIDCSARAQPSPPHARPLVSTPWSPCAWRLPFWNQGIVAFSWGFLKAPILDPKAPWPVAPRPDSQCREG